jgi:hypothetical protein
MNNFSRVCLEKIAAQQRKEFTFLDLLPNIAFGGLAGLAFGRFRINKELAQIGRLSAFLASHGLPVNPQLAMLRAAPKLMKRIFPRYALYGALLGGLIPAAAYGLSQMRVR